MSEQAPKLRVDKWLWAARFYKTRSLAAAAVEGGRVRVNGERAKPAREVKAGDALDITLGEARWSLRVQAVAARRGPAPEAQALYVETDESRERRRQQAEARRLRAADGTGPAGRPTKRDRRRLERFSRGDA